jgi:flagellar FliJ protein
VTGPSFRFRLERVRALRERREKLARQDLATAITQLSSTREDLQSADLRLERARRQQRDAACERGTVSADELRAQQAFVERVEAQRRVHGHELVQREAEVAQRDAELSTAAGDHEMLKRLRERQRKAHEREVARREVNLLDELAAIRFNRSVA